MSEPKPLERHHLYRLLTVALGISLLFPAFVWRLYHIQYVCHPKYLERAQKQHNTSVAIAPQRGTIFSRTGHPLATSRFLYTLYVAGNAIGGSSTRSAEETRDRLVVELANCLDLSEEYVRSRLDRNRDSKLVGDLERDKVFEIESIRSMLGVPEQALYAEKVGEREHPKGSLAAHVVGLTKPDERGNDEVGLSGAEAAFDDEIRGSFVQERIPIRNLSPLEERTLLSAMGNDVVLTIDEAIQHYAETALAKQVEALGAKGGVCVVLEVGTGAVLAMVSNPAFDPNDRSLPPTRNRCLTDAISPGSVMKVFTATALIERNLLSPYETVDCHNGRHTFVNNRVIKDSHPMGVVSVRAAFAESSNVAFAGLGLRLTNRQFFGHLCDFGFGRPTGIEVPGEGRGILHPLNEWNGEGSRISLSIGYELLVTPIQLASAAAAIANRGEYVRPHVLKEVRSPRGDVVRRVRPEVIGRVCSPQTAELVLNLMEAVVLEGTGRDTALPGYRVGGKTGTTVKDTPGEDGDKAYIGSYLMVLPLERPRVVIYCWIDEPDWSIDREWRWGSRTAAPVCREVAEHAARILAIEPTCKAPRTLEEPLDADPRVMAEMAPRTEALPPPPEGSMPDLGGLTVREVAERLHEMKIDAHFTGWGVATRQQPPPGDPLPATRALVIFEQPYPQKTTP